MTQRNRVPLLILAAVAMLGFALSASSAVAVNAESPGGIIDTIDEWQWQWDDQTEVGHFAAPTTYYDRRHGRSYSRGELELTYQLRIPEDRDAIRGIIVMVPGLDQHSGRYRYLVDRLKDEFVIASCDTRFMGRSNPEIDPEAALGDIPNRRAHRRLSLVRKLFYIVYDFDLFLHGVLPRQMAEEGLAFEDYPLVMVGHSLGGLVVLDYVLGNDFNQPPPNLTGVILSNPALRPPRGVPSVFQKIMINYNYHVNASFGPGTEERTLFLVAYEQMRNIIMTPIFYLTAQTRVQVDSEWVAEWVTDDPWEQIGFQLDPMTLRSNPLNFIYQVQEHMIEIRHRHSLMRWPYLLLYSPNDQIVAPNGAIEFAARTQSNNAENRVVAFPETYAHELFRARPVVRERAFDEIEGWLDQLLGD